jgi:antitoxin (DNA-binding transcriptional repressor) of toxin-antitoxin stability system
VIYQGERIILERHGKDVVALVPVTDLELLEELEDRIDLEEARKRLKERGRIPWDKIKERLGL